MKGLLKWGVGGEWSEEG